MFITITKSNVDDRISTQEITSKQLIIGLRHRFLINFIVNLIATFLLHNISTHSSIYKVLK